MNTSQESSMSCITASYSSNKQLEQFLILAKSAKGVALRELVKQVMESKDIYFFGELLEIQAVQDLENDPSSSSYLTLLKIFAYGTFKDYLAQSLPEMSDIMCMKLRHLTVASMATKLKYIPYTDLLNELHMTSTRQLEDLLISAIYANVIRGKLDQQNSRLEVDWTIGRDICPQSLETISTTLSLWCDACGSMLEGIKTQVKMANASLEDSQKKKKDIEQEVSNIRKTIKAAGQEMDLSASDILAQPMPSAGPEKPKKSKIKSLRGSQVKQLWSKN